jgi:hypothetical protein
MRASSNNHYQKSLIPFADIPIHSTKRSEGDTGYYSLPNDPLDDIIILAEKFPSPTDISTTHNTSDLVLSVEQRIVEYSKIIQSTTPPPPTRKLHRTRVQPIPDSTSDSADSFALSNHLVLVSSYQQQISSIDLPSFGGDLEFKHDNRFDSITTVDHVKNDVIAIELMEQSQQQQTNQILDTLPSNEQQLSWIKRLGESIRLLPANLLAVVFIGLVGGLIVSVILVIIIA